MDKCDLKQCLSEHTCPQSSLCVAFIPASQVPISHRCAVINQQCLLTSRNPHNNTRHVYTMVNKAHAMVSSILSRNNVALFCYSAKHRLNSRR